MTSNVCAAPSSRTSPAGTAPGARAHARDRGAVASRGLVAALAAACALAAAPGTARAQDNGAARGGDLRAAAEAYDNATRAYLQRDFNAAANWFEAADRLAPSMLALQGAVRAHRQAGGGYHLARAATLALRLRARYGENRRAAAFAQRTLADLGQQVARVTVECGACEVEADGVLQSAREFFVTPGEHTFSGYWPGNRRRQEVRAVAAGESATVTLAEPPVPRPRVAPRVVRAQPAPPPPPSGPRVLHPAVAITGAVVTLGLGIGAAINWGDAVGRADRLLRHAEQTGMGDPAAEAALTAAEDRTTGLVIATAAVGALTVVTAAVFTRWVRGESRPAPAVVVAPSASVGPRGGAVAGVTVAGAF